MGEGSAASCRSWSAKIAPSRTKLPSTPPAQRVFSLRVVEKNELLLLRFGPQRTKLGSDFNRSGSVIERVNFEPLGERLTPDRGDRSQSAASRYLLRAGSGIFWSLVAAIVLARAAWFEPGIYDGFNRVAALAKSAIF